MRKNRLFALIAIVFLLLLCTGLYLNSLNNSFHFDDLPSIVENPYIRDLTDVPSLLKGIRSTTGRFRVLSTLSFGINYHFHKLDVFGYHLVNLALHVLCGILVFFISRDLFVLGFQEKRGPRGDEIPLGAREASLLALLSSAIFVAHPIQVNTVTYIVERNEGLASFFYLLCFFLFIRGTRGAGRRRLILFVTAGISFFCSIFSKEIGFTLPIVLILFDFLFVCRKREAFMTRLKVYIPLSLFLAIYILFFFQGGMLRQLIKGSPDWLWTPWENLLTQSNVFMQYFKLFFLPFPQWLSVDHDFPLSRSLFQYPTFLSFSVVILLFLVAALLVRKNSVVSFSIFWFFIVLAPTSSLIPLWDIMVEYRLYLPLFSYSLILTLVLHYVYRQLANRFSRNIGLTVAAGISIVLLGFYSVVTIERNRVFKDDLTLWTDAVKKSPNKLRVHHNLGRAYFAKGRIDEAIREGETALSLSGPLDQKEIVKYVLNLLGGAYFVKGRMDEALTMFQRGLAIDPDFATSYYNISCIYATRNEKGKALEYLNKAIALKPIYKEKARTDRDFEVLRGEKEFQKMIY